MTAINDVRRLRVYKIVGSRGEFKYEPGADIWQETSGKVVVSGLWDGILVGSSEDLQLQAQALALSPLEYLRQRLLRCPGVQVEVIG